MQPLFRFLGLLTLTAAMGKAGIYFDAGYQRTGSDNSGYFGVGGAVHVVGPVQFLGEADFAGVARGQASYTAIPGGSSASASGQAFLWGFNGGIRLPFAKTESHEFFTLGTLGFQRFAASGSASYEVVGGQSFAQASSSSQTAGLTTIGGGVLFGGKVRIGPEVRYLRYFGDLKANGVRLGLLLYFGK